MSLFFIVLVAILGQTPCLHAHSCPSVDVGTGLSKRGEPNWLPTEGPYNQQGRGNLPDMGFQNMVIAGAGLETGRMIVGVAAPVVLVGAGAAAAGAGAAVLGTGYLATQGAIQGARLATRGARHVYNAAQNAYPHVRDGVANVAGLATQLLTDQPIFQQDGRGIFKEWGYDDSSASHQHSDDDEASLGGSQQEQEESIYYTAQAGGSDNDAESHQPQMSARRRARLDRQASVTSRPRRAVLEEHDGDEGIPVDAGMQTRVDVPLQLLGNDERGLTRQQRRVEGRQRLERERRERAAFRRRAQQLHMQRDHQPARQGHEDGHQQDFHISGEIPNPWDLNVQPR